MYDYIVVGAGIFGSTVARCLADKGKRVLVLDKRPHIAGNCYTELSEGIMVHRYGAHIFHTDYKEVWDFLSRFAKFNDYHHTVTANYHDELYSLPFNMNTFHQIWGVNTVEEAKARLQQEIEAFQEGDKDNLELHAISMVGEEIYEKLVKHYTEKQWGRPCRELPSSIIKRLPLRMSYDNSYFADKYQGIPVDGYTAMIEKMLEGIELRLSENFLDKKEYYESMADKIIYTGSVDELMDYRYGALEYRSVNFENELLSEDSFQGSAVINYTGDEVEWTRIIEHKYFDPNSTAGGHTIISREYSAEWRPGVEPYYPINNDRNTSLYEKYRESLDSKYLLGGRLGDYRYYDMDDAVLAAMELAKQITEEAEKEIKKEAEKVAEKVAEKETSKATANACIHCHICRDNCDFLGKYGIDIGDTDRLRELAYHCFLCGKCTEVCPLKIDGREIILNMRRDIVVNNTAGIENSYKHTLKEKKDYIFRNWKHATSGTVFFPGCNFPSLYPKTNSLLSKLFAEHGIGTIYECCGKPIASLGFKSDEANIVEALKKRIAEHNIEEVVLACPNCREYLGDKLGVKITSVYSKLQELGIGESIDEDVLFFLPCPDRAQRQWVEEIKPFINGEISFVEGVQCCGLGGNAARLEPELAAGFAEKIKKNYEGRIFTYCASCNGSLRRNGCPAVDHILSLVLGTDENPDTKKSYVNRMLTKLK